MAKKSSLQSLSYILRHESYGEFTHGDVVLIRGERGTWHFRHHCVNTDTGSEWLDVFGGEKGYETLRAFRPERVRAVPVRGRRAPKRLTLADLL